MSQMTWNIKTNQWEYKIGKIWVPIIELDPIRGKVLNDIGPDATNEQLEILNNPIFIQAVDERFAETPAYRKLSDEDGGREGQPVVPYMPGKAPSEQPPEEEIPPPTRYRPAVWPPLDENDQVDIVKVLKYYEAYGNPTDPNEAEVNAGRRYATKEESDAELPEGFHSDSFTNNKGQTFWTHIKNEESQNRPNVFGTEEEAAAAGGPGFRGKPTESGYVPERIPLINELVADIDAEIDKLLIAGDMAGALKLDAMRDLVNEKRGGEGLSFEDAFSFASGLAKSTGEFEKLFAIASGIKEIEPEDFKPFQIPENSRSSTSGFNIANVGGQPQITNAGFYDFDQGGPPQLPYDAQFAATGTPPSGFVTGEDPTEVPPGSSFAGLQTATPPFIRFGDELPGEVPGGSPFAGIADTETEAAATANAKSPGLNINPVGDNGAGVFDLSGVSQEDINRYFPSDDAWREEQARKKAAKGKNPFVLAASNAFELTMKARQDQARNKRGIPKVAYR